MSTAIKLRGDSTANWSINNPLLLEREIVVDTTLLRFKIGDGVTLYNSLPYMDAALVTELGLKAPINNPTFTGRVFVPTPNGEGIANQAAKQGTLDDRVPVPTNLTADKYLRSNDDGSSNWVDVYNGPSFTGIVEIGDALVLNDAIMTFSGQASIENAVLTGTATLNGEPLGTNNLNGTNYLMVYGTGTAEDNAAELQAAYDEAKKMPRYLGQIGDSSTQTIYAGQAFYYSPGPNIYVVASVTGEGPYNVQATSISQTIAKATRTTIVVAPGDYTFGTTKFAVNKSGINIVSLTGNSDVKLDGINVTADYVYIKGIDCASYTFAIANDLNNIIIENCNGGNSSFGSSFSGTAINCIGGDYSFGCYSTFSGTAINCIGGDYSFGCYSTFSGTAINCTGGIGSFAGGGGTFSSTGYTKYCKLTTGSWSAINVSTGGKIINCINADGSVYSSVNVEAPNISAKSYKVFSGIFSQTAVGDFSVTQLENTIGNIVWSSTSSGEITGNLTGAFTVNKTVCPQDNTYSYGSAREYILSTNSNINTFYIWSETLADGIPIDNKLKNKFIEIRVYN